MRRNFSACASRIFKLAKRKIFSNAVAVGNRLRDKVFSNLHRVRQIVSERERGANRGGISAAGSVRGNAFDKWRRQQQFIFAIEENINRHAGILQVSTFNQNCAAVARMNFAGD